MFRWLFQRFKPPAFTAAIDVVEDPFSAFALALTELDASKIDRLPEWQKPVRLFADLMKGIASEGLLGAFANEWPSRAMMLSALRTLGMDRIAERIEPALGLTVECGAANNFECQQERVWDDTAAMAAFDAAEAFIEGEWDALWTQAQRYSEAQGWSSNVR